MEIPNSNRELGGTTVVSKIQKKRKKIFKQNTVFFEKDYTIVYLKGILITSFPGAAFGLGSKNFQKQLKICSYFAIAIAYQDKNRSFSATILHCKL